MVNVSVKSSHLKRMFRSFASAAGKSGRAGRAGRAANTTEISSSEVPSTAFIDDARIPLMRYVVGDIPWRRFKEKRATTEERKKVIEALKTFLPRRPSHLIAVEAAREALHAQSILPIVQSGREAETPLPQEILERIKPTVMEALGVEASQYDQVAEEILRAHAEEHGTVTIEGGEDGVVLQPTPTAVTTNPTMSQAQRATVSSIINEITR